VAVQRSPRARRHWQHVHHSAVEPTQAGQYSVLVLNDAGSVTSPGATLTVLDEPTISFVRREIARPTVRLVATPPAGVSVYAVEDQVSPTSAIDNISHGGVFDPATGKVKFGPFYDAIPRTLSYAVIIPPGCLYGRCATYTFAGTASADGVDSPIAGDDVMVVVGLHRPICRQPTVKSRSGRSRPTAQPGDGAKHGQSRPCRFRSIM